MNRLVLAQGGEGQHNIQAKQSKADFAHSAPLFLALQKVALLHMVFPGATGNLIIGIDPRFNEPFLHCMFKK